MEHRENERTERINVSAKPDWLQRLDDWRFANRIDSRSEAIRKLVDQGIGASNKERA